MKSKAQTRLLVKICGMKYAENIRQIADLQPDYLGFIFYSKSPRYFETEMPNISSDIKKVGIFVNENIDEIGLKIENYALKAIQLHADESPSFCKELKKKHKDVEIIKAFAVDETFDFSTLIPYENEVDYFLFDTKGKNHGGNGVAFDWKLLENYSFQKPFFLSGGIGINEIEQIKLMKNKGLPLFAIDVNSKFEIEAGLKNEKLLRSFLEQI
ncbi:MAG: phosphoribosylanthranilate isomerase [Capnocytophaga sp.]|nr:phosphoribosylanthranilate isomerase [Capnocytophaga sp.]